MVTNLRTKNELCKIQAKKKNDC